MSFIVAYLKSLGDFLVDVAIVLVPLIAFLLVFKLLIRGRYRLSGQDLDRELQSPDNNAVNILVVGLFFGLMLAFQGLAFARDTSLVARAIQVVAFGLAAIALQLLAQFLANKLILHRTNDIEQVFVHKNNSVACVKAAIAVATGQMIAATAGVGFRLAWQALIWLAVGQAILVLIGQFYQWITPYDVQAELEKKNLSVGLGFSGLIVAGGLVVSRAVRGGETQSWGAELLSVFSYVVTLLLVAFLMRLLFDRMVLPKGSMNTEISEHQNVGVGLVEAAGYVLPAMYFVGII